MANPSSIEQITNLQKYKEEQSKKAYYRVFNDDDSFMNLAMREIRMWLRDITKTAKESPAVVNDVSSNTDNVESNGKTETTEKPLVDNNNSPTVVPADTENTACGCYTARGSDPLVQAICKVGSCRAFP